MAFYLIFHCFSVRWRGRLLRWVTECSWKLSTTQTCRSSGMPNESKPYLSFQTSRYEHFELAACCSPETPKWMFSLQSCVHFKRFSMVYIFKTVLPTSDCISSDKHPCESSVTGAKSFHSILKTFVCAHLSSFSSFLQTWAFVLSRWPLFYSLAASAAASAFTSSFPTARRPLQWTRDAAALLGSSLCSRQQAKCNQYHIIIIIYCLRDRSCPLLGWCCQYQNMVSSQASFDRVNVVAAFIVDWDSLQAWSLCLCLFYH